MTDIEDELNLPHPSLHSIHPSRPLYEACKLLLQSHARRLPIIDHDTTSDMELIAAVLTPYRLMKFVANNVRVTLF
jgi:5'-AMP-activated protein kinase, regulatory gamma subunit